MSPRSVYVYSSVGEPPSSNQDSNTGPIIYFALHRWRLACRIFSSHAINTRAITGHFSFNGLLHLNCLYLFTAFLITWHVSIERVSVAVTLKPRILEVPCSNLGQNTDYHEDFHRFPQCFHANARIVLRLGDDHFQILTNSSIILSFDNNSVVSDSIVK